MNLYFFVFTVLNLSIAYGTTQSNTHDDVVMNGQKIDCFVESSGEEEQSVCVLDGFGEERAKVEWGEGEEKKILIADNIKAWWKKKKKTNGSSSALKGLFDDKKATDIEKIVAEGNVVVTYKEMILKGRTCTYRPINAALKEGIIICQGDSKNLVTVSDGKHTGEGDEVRYDMKKNLYTLHSNSSHSVRAMMPVEAKKRS